MDAGWIQCTTDMPLCVCVCERERERERERENPMESKLSKSFHGKLQYTFCIQPFIANFLLCFWWSSVHDRVRCNFQQRLITECVCHFVSAKNLLQGFVSWGVWIVWVSLCLQFTPQLTNPCKRNAKSEIVLKHNMVEECGVCNGM
jgi:hypothetical protein